MLFINALQSVFGVIIIMFTGYLLTARGWFDKEISSLFTKLVIKVSLPALMINNLLTSFSKDQLLTMFGGLLIPFTGIILSYLISIPVSYLFKIRRGRRGLFRALFTFSNTVFIGLPVNIAIFGERSVPHAIVYYLAHTTIFWTLGLYGIRRDNQKDKETNLISLKELKHIISPPLIAFAGSTVLIFSGLSLPDFVMIVTKYIGNLTTPLSLLTIGIIIYNIDFEKFSINRDMIGILLGKFVITPLIIYYLFSFFIRPELMKNVFVLEAGMPIMATIAIVGKAYDADYDYATLMIMVSIVVSFFAIPLYLLFLG